MLSQYEIAPTESLITKPTVAPLDLEFVKKQRRFTATSLDTLFDLWINAAVDHFEEQTGRQLITASWRYGLDGFPYQRRIELPHPPLQSVESITYDDGNGDEQTVDTDTYRVVTASGPHATRGYVELKYGLSWPVAACWSNGVRINYTAGYGAAPGAVPELFRHALLMLVGHFHKFGEEVNEARGNVLQLPIGAAAIIEAAKFSALPQLPRPSRSLAAGGGAYGLSQCR